MAFKEHKPILIEANILVEGESVQVMKIISLQYELKFLTDFMPYVFLTIRIPLTTASLLPTDKLEIELIKDGESTVYTAYPIELPDAVTTVKNRNISVHDIGTEMVEITYQLVNEEFHAKSLYRGAIGISNATVTDALLQIGDATGMEMVISDAVNVKKHTYVSVPTARVTKIPELIQSVYGIYNSDVGVWFEKDKIKIYPMFDYLREDQVVLQYDRTSHFSPKSDIMTVSEYSFIDRADTIINERGSAISTGYAESVMTRPFDTKAHNVDRSSTEVTQSITGKGKVVSSPSTSNTYKLRSEVVRNSMVRVEVTVNKVTLEEILPCMPIQLIIEEGKKPLVYQGIVGHAKIFYDPKGHAFAKLILLIDIRTRSDSTSVKK